ncbi:Receptor protein kinase-like protein [Planoprotostelium fungivorum]|uniref:Receptor protein kinase-like protein n=1 Tax=Planoprotostelium fungivorum TaxID=1890364 RepID=A0A2P6MVB8_9EUKA|nr:Receptor protein kinase-like protein [Planoprotostelium fungivorum]
MRTCILLIACLACCFLSVDANTLSTLKNIWKTLNGIGSPTLWIGNNFCNSTDFQGITCNNGNVIQILLSRPLSGSLNPKIGDLDTLQSLTIQGANLNGPIPSSVGSLSNLLTLDLGGNRLTGVIPETICQLHQLSNLNLRANRLEGNIPSCVGGMTNLTQIFLNDNQFQGKISSSISLLVNLKVFNVNNNQLTGNIPSEISNLNALQILDLSSNELNGTIPDGIGYLSNLKTLYLCSNNLTGSIPSSIGNVSNLQYLDLNGNNLTGRIPNSIGNLIYLYTLDVSDNQLTGMIPSSIGNLSSITTIDLGGNDLTGIIPTTIGNLVYLSVLLVPSNRLEGQIPSQICDISNLGSLILVMSSYLLLVSADTRQAGNLINGSIPSCLSSILTPDLYHLDLSNNQLTGSIPSSLGGLYDLTNLYLDNNRLTGSIPSSFSNLDSLDVLRLQGNQLSGSIPDLTKIFGDHFDLSSNQLNGSLLPGWSVAYLNVSHNQLMGRIPMIYSIYIDMSHNKFNSIENHFAQTGIALQYCDLTFNEFPCVPAQPSENCNITCQTSGDQIYNSNSSLTVNGAQAILNQVTVPIDQLPGILSALISILLKNSSTFSLRTNDSNLYVNTYSATSTERLTVKLPNTSISAVFPSSSISSRGLLHPSVCNWTEVGTDQIAVAVSIISFNPFASIDNTTTYGGVIGVTVYDIEGEVRVTGTELINITMGMLPSSFPFSAEAECLWWQETEERWQRDGCNATRRADDVIVCQCNHLTNFTLGLRPSRANVLNDLSPVQPNNTQNPAIVIAACAAGGGLLSIIIVSLIVFFLLRGRRGSNGVDVVMQSQSDAKMKIEYENVIHDGRCKIWKGKLDETTTVAIKKAKEQKRERELIVEATTLKGMHHPNIVMYIGQDTAEGYFVMEHMNGGSLQQYMTSQALDTSSVLVIAADVARGLSYLTSINMTHIRLSPEKILLSITDGEVSAKIGGMIHVYCIDSPANPHSFGVYTAPEVIENGTYQTSSSVWSFGVLLFAMAKNDANVYDRRDEKQSGAQSFVVIEADEMIATLIMQCTRREVELRLEIQHVVGRLTTEVRREEGGCSHGGERILCFNNDLLYEATIMGIEQKDGKESYQIHYEGWDEKRDEWVNIEKLKKLNKENLRMQAFLRAEVKQQAPKAPTPIKSQVTTKKKTKDQFEIVLPTQIRERLVEDQRMINKKFLTEVPRTPNIEQIIGDFTKDYFAVMQVIDTYPTEKKNEILFNLKFTYNPFIAQKIADDLIRFFDEICGNVLVYRFERKQFTTATKLSASLSQVYGIEYLMRFLGLKRTVKIPLFIDRAELEEDALLHTK